MDPTQRVCPECGQPAGSQPFCAACGKNLSGVDWLPSREEWERAHRPSEQPPAPPGALWTAPAQSPPTEEPTREPADRPAVEPGPEAPTEVQAASGTTLEAPPPSHATAPPAPLAAPASRAHWGYRVGAWLIDAGTAVSVGLGIGLLLKQSSSVDTAESVGGLSILAAWVLLTAGFSNKLGGQSLGKWVAGVRVIRHGQPALFGRIFLRDTVAGILYIVPLFFLVNAMFPLGSERRSVIDRMVGTDVVETDRIRGRVPALVAGAVLAVGAWIGLTAADGRFASDHYTRAEWVSDCTDGGADSATCGCIYDELKSRMSQSDLDELQTADKADDIFPGAQQILDDAITACR